MGSRRGLLKPGWARKREESQHHRGAKDMIRHVAPLARVSWMATDWSMLRAHEARAGGPKAGPEAAREQQQQQPWGDAKLRDAAQGGQTRTGTGTRTGIGTRTGDAATLGPTEAPRDPSLLVQLPAGLLGPEVAEARPAPGLPQAFR